MNQCYNTTNYWLKPISQKEKTSMLTFVALLFSTTAFIAKAEDVVSLCNGCTSSQIEKVALQSQVYGGIVHVVDFTTGQSKSFDVAHDSEPGFEFHTATPVNTPDEVATAARSVNELVK